MNQSLSKSSYFFFDFVDSFVDVLAECFPHVLHFEILVGAFHCQSDVVAFGKLYLLTDLLVDLFLFNVRDHVPHLEVLVQVVGE